MQRAGNQPEQLRVMGRLQAVMTQRLVVRWAGTLALCAVGCDGDRGSQISSRPRIAAVTAAAPPPAARPAATASAHAGGASAPSKPRPPLCAGQLARSGRRLAEVKLDTAVAGDAQPPTSLGASGGRWTWVNLWAAWCVPCKEEIPRLLAWNRQLAAAKPGMEVRFLSLDDDPRQLQRFLDGQPSTGLRATYWLHEGEEREEWLVSAGVDPDPELPAHVLLGPDGKVRCVVQGAVEEGDLPSALGIASGTRG